MEAARPQTARAPPGTPRRRPQRARASLPTRTARRAPKRARGQPPDKTRLRASRGPPSARATVDTALFPQRTSPVAMNGKRGGPTECDGPDPPASYNRVNVGLRRRQLLLPPCRPRDGALPGGREDAGDPLPRGEGRRLDHDG